jgi:hypothetical protein
MTLFAFKLVDRNLYLKRDVSIADPFGSVQRADSTFHKKRELFRAVMDHVADNQILSATACRIVRSENHSTRDDMSYKRIHIYLVTDEKNGSLLRLFFPQLKWERWSEQRLKNRCGKRWRQ